ncbi:MAG: hypothetical protein KHX03_06250 [Clostridium sp.]|nr:hypothetical protein [Clostridium sp.]
MANIANFKINTDANWVNIEDKIKETKSDFAFTDGKTYLIQVFAPHKICISASGEPSGGDGFEKSDEPFSYTHSTGTGLYVKSKYVKQYSQIEINVAE